MPAPRPVKISYLLKRYFIALAARWPANLWWKGVLSACAPFFPEDVDKALVHRQHLCMMLGASSPA